MEGLLVGNRSMRFSELFSIGELKIIKSNKTIFVELFAYFNGTSKQFVGVSKCHPKDSFDEQRGIDLAKHRAQEKAYQWCISMIDKEIHSLDVLRKDYLKMQDKAITKKFQQKIFEELLTL